MIHRDVLVLDLHPPTWRNLGRVLRIDELSASRPVLPKTLSILHQSGKVLKSVVPQGLKVQIDMPIHDARQVAQDLYRVFADKIDGVQIFEKTSLVEFSDAVQQLDWQQLNCGEFYLKAFELARMDTTGIVYHPASCAPYLYTVLDQAQRLISNTPDGQTLVLGIFDEGKPYFTLILKVMHQTVTFCTTFEYLQPFGLDPDVVPSSINDVESVLRLVNQHIGTVAHSMFCDRTTYEGWRNDLISRATWNDNVPVVAE